MYTTYIIKVFNCFFGTTFSTFEYEISDSRIISSDISFSMPTNFTKSDTRCRGSCYDRVTLPVISLTSVVAVSTKWIWYEIFAGDSDLDSLPRIKYKINCDDTFLVRLGTHRPPFRALFIVYASWNDISRPGGRATARCLGPMTIVATSTTIRHEDLRLWCPLRRTPASGSSLFSDISGDHRRRTGDR